MPAANHPRRSKLGNSLLFQPRTWTVGGQGGSDPAAVRLLCRSPQVSRTKGAGDWALSARYWLYDRRRFYSKAYQ